MVKPGSSFEQTMKGSIPQCSMPFVKISSLVPEKFFSKVLTKCGCGLKSLDIKTIYMNIAPGPEPPTSGNKSYSALLS